MNVAELRIGNYVQDHANDIHEIFSLDSSFINWDENTAFGLDPFGIPITEEWLLKLGFIKGNNDSHWSDGKTGYVPELYILKNTLFGLINELNSFFLINKFPYEYNPQCWDYEKVSIDIKHVHQLQNLYYSLTGTELILDSEK